MALVYCRVAPVDGRFCLGGGFVTRRVSRPSLLLLFGVATVVLELLDVTLSFDDFVFALSITAPINPSNIKTTNNAFVPTTMKPQNSEKKLLIAEVILENLADES